MTTVELNDQEMDIVLGGIERLSEQLKSAGHTEDLEPVTKLMERLIGEWNQEGGCSGNCSCK